ncbi:hypothetical protein [Caldifermentibacillus hisashii]|uniref:hypothetical protein n=1 Tax=Caldifermentibacillus hisashii TaxID=996558 RepID=UPI0034D7711B
MATRFILATFLGRETPIFGDDTLSRHHFKPENSLFWRRDPFSSSFFGRKNLFFGDEALSRRHFEPRNFTFWRRDSFSSSF